MEKKRKYPWITRGWDFSQPGWHSKPSSAYQLMVMALRISPSYELARKVRSGESTQSDLKKLPKDFDQVLETFDLIGDVTKIIFRNWWLRGGIEIFATPYTKPDIKVLDTFVFEEIVDKKELSKNLEVNLINERLSEGLPPAMLLSIPLTLSKTEILKKIKRILNETKTQTPELPKQPLIKLMGQRINSKAILRGFTLLWAKSAHPERELWRLGAQAKISATYSSVLNYKGPRKPKDAIEMNDRIILSKITFRTLKRYELIVENAARGRFPCDANVECAEFDYPAIEARELSHRKWRKELQDNWLKTRGWI